MENVFSNIYSRYKEGKLPHAFLFETNDISRCYNETLDLVKKINCPHTFSDDCSSECNLCNLINTGSLPSLVTIEADGKFIRKNQILDLMEQFNTKPVFSKYNMYIIKGAEDFNSSSANTFLKFLEEPEEGILGFFITNNKENVISTIRSRCQVYTIFYDDEVTVLDEDMLINVKLYLNSIYKSPDDILYNKTHMIPLYKERSDWEKFFNTMLYYLKDCYNNKRNDKIDIVKELSIPNIINVIVLIEQILKYLRSNGNVDLILDKFVIEMRKFYG